LKSPYYKFVTATQLKDLTRRLTPHELFAPLIEQFLLLLLYSSRYVRLGGIGGRYRNRAWDSKCHRQN